MLLCALAAGAFVVVAGIGDTRTPVARAAADLSGWEGASYRGVLVDPDGVATTVEVTVAADGSAAGVTGRDFGARAEFASNGSETLVKGNRQWWLYDQPAVADQLADRWVVNPARSPVPVAALTPTGLAAQLSSPSDAVWAELGDRSVDQRPGRLYSDGARYAVLTVSAPYRVLSVDLPLAVQAQPVPRAFATQDGTASDLTRDWKQWRATFQFTEPDATEIGRVRAAANTIKKASQAGSPPKTVDELTAAQQDVPPDLLDRLARQGVDPAAAKGAGVYGRPMLEALDALTQRGVDARTATFMVDLAARGRALAAFHQVVTSGKLHQPDALDGFMKKIKSLGQLRHLEEAAHLTAAGHEIVLDGDYIPDPAAPGQKYKADILDLTARDADQVKTLTSSSPTQILQEYDKAAQQLSGTNGEVVPPGFDGVVHLRFEPGSYGGLATASRAEVRRTMQRIADPRKGSYARNGAVKKIVVTNYARMTPDSPRATREEFDPRELDPPTTPGDAAQPNPNSPAPAPQAAPLPQAAPAPAPAAARRPLFSPSAGGAPKGPLADLAAQPPGMRPGGVDFSTLELRYLADTGSAEHPAMQYAFSAQPATGGGEQGAAGLGAAGLASDAFFVWLSLPRSAFWVNLNPDQPDRVIDPEFGRTDVGRVLLEADLALKRAWARLSLPNNPVGSAYWQARTSAGLGQLCYPSRLWIVPGPAKIHEESNALHILAAPLLVNQEPADIRTKPAGFQCTTPTPEALAAMDDINRRIVLPHLQKAVNTAPEYAPLRQVYLSRVAAEWYRQRSAHQSTGYAGLIDDGDIGRWVSADPWSPRGVWDTYRASYVNGEYTAPVRTTDGTQNFTSGGVDMANVELAPVGPEELHTTWAGRTDTIDTAFDHPILDRDGRLWLASATPSSDLVLPPTPVLIGAGAVLAALWLRYRWWRRKRRRTRAQKKAQRPPAARRPPAGPPSDAAVAERLARLRNETRR